MKSDLECANEALLDYYDGSEDDDGPDVDRLAESLRYVIDWAREREDDLGRKERRAKADVQTARRREANSAKCDGWPDGAGGVKTGYVALGMSGPLGMFRTNEDALEYFRLLGMTGGLVVKVPFKTDLFDERANDAGPGFSEKAGR